MDLQDTKTDSIDTFINFIKLFNLNIVLGFRQPRAIKQCGQKARHLLKQFDKFVSEYEKRALKEMKKSKLVLPPIIFRKEMHLINDQNFMRFQENGYVMKYTFVRKESELTANVEIYRMNNGVKMSSVAFQKLEILFLHEISNLIQVVCQSDEGVRDLIEKQSKQFLLDVIQILKGQKCLKCKQFMMLSRTEKIFLPPTLRALSETKGNGNKFDYFHEGCI